MGGKVFSKGDDALNIPRMPPTVYDFVKRRAQLALKELKFSRVASPIETPEKESFGDVDILVCLEGKDVPFPPTAADFTGPHWDQVAKSLGAKRSVQFNTIGPGKKRIFDSMSFAVDWPLQFASNPAGQEEEPGAKPTPCYSQIDVRLCDTQSEMEWRLYKHNHGDLWNMIGQIIRPFGLTADEVGLHIRIPEIEEQNKKKARVLLTSDPEEANAFLGLKWPNGGWNKEFRSLNELFECAASCRWFMLWPSDEYDEDNAKDGSDKEKKPPSEKKKEATKKEQRPIFARWVDEFKPACRAKGRFLVPNPEERTWRTVCEEVREEVRKEAFETFPGKEAEYDTRLTDWKKEENRVRVKNTIIKEAKFLPNDLKPYLPEPSDRDGDKDARLAAIERQWRSVLISALQKIIVDDDDSFDGVAPPKLRDSKGVLDIDRVTDWLNINWPDVGIVAWERQRARERDHMDRSAAEEAGRKEDGGTARAAEDKKT